MTATDPPPAGFDFTTDDAIEDVLDAYQECLTGVGDPSRRLAALFVRIDTLKTQYEDTRAYPPSA